MPIAPQEQAFRVAQQLNTPILGDQIPLFKRDRQQHVGRRARRKQQMSGERGGFSP